MDKNEALNKLIDGNSHYLTAQNSVGDISQSIRTTTCNNGQHPYAVVITCSDSRVIPECIFQAGIGDLFVIRVAGNVMDNHQLGSVEYAVSHLGCNLVVVLGHTHCGAVASALHHKSSGYVKYITDKILQASSGEKDETKVCKMNVLQSVKEITNSCALPASTQVIGAIYDIASGQVNFL